MDLDEFARSFASLVCVLKQMLFIFMAHYGIADVNKLKKKMLGNILKCELSFTPNV